MSRMLNAVRDTLVARGMEAKVSAPPAEVVDDVFVNPAPFIEIGGPDGPIFSVPSAILSKPTPPKLAAQPAAVPEVVPFPRLATPEPRYLSISFHELIARSKEAPKADGLAYELVAHHFPDHPISAEYRTLRDEIRGQLPEATPRALLFTAAAAEAGTTTVLLNLAITFAREGTGRVLVVDANSARPAIAPRLAMKEAPGLAEVLVSQVPLAWAVQASTVPNLQVLPIGLSNAETPSAISEELPKLLVQLRQWYDWVLIDAGVWGEMPERDAACPGADAVYLVSREANVGRPEFEGLRGWVRQLGGLLRGYVTTRA